MEISDGPREGKSVLKPGACRCSHQRGPLLANVLVVSVRNGLGEFDWLGWSTRSNWLAITKEAHSFRTFLLYLRGTGWGKFDWLGCSIRWIWLATTREAHSFRTFLQYVPARNGLGSFFCLSANRFGHLRYARLLVDSVNLIDSINKLMDINSSP